MNKLWSQDIMMASEPARKIETIFKVEPPLKTIENGFGFLGVLLRDTEKDQLQCHICGTWWESLSSHIVKRHRIKVKEYQQTFSLPYSVPLQSNAMLKKRSQMMSSPEWLARWKNYSKIRRGDGKREKGTYAKWSKNNMGYLNRYGICPEQLLRRYMLIVDAIGKEPSYYDIQERDPGIIAPIKKRYGTLNNFRNNHGFQIRKQRPLHSDDKILGHLRNFKFKYGRNPLGKDFKGKAIHGVSWSAVRNRFGSFNKALALAGLT